MFESDDDGAGVAHGSAEAEAGRLVELVDRVCGLAQPASDAERVDQISLLEQLKSAAAAVQAQAAADFAASQEAAQQDAGEPPERVGRGVAAQVGLARRESPARARRYLGWARVLTAELPHTFAALRAGEITEWRAMIVARETGWLSLEHRARVDAELAGRLGAWGDRRVEAETRKAAYRLDPHGAADRCRRKTADRRVTLRPAPDTMTVLSGLLPVTQGVAVHASLARHADALRAQGDPRGRGQIMADTLVERVTGQSAAAATPIEVNLVITDHSLFGGGDEPAHVDGHGPVPAPWARRLLRECDAADEDTRVWVRRLFTRPGSGELVAMESRRRCFDGGLRRFLIARDQYCRTPYCGAPIRHLDHILPAELGGPTSVANGQGLCQACNYAKQAPGWHTALTTTSTIQAPVGVTEAVTITTPTGHTYTSRPPDPPRQHHVSFSPLEERLRNLLRAA